MKYGLLNYDISTNYSFVFVAHSGFMRNVLGYTYTEALGRARRRNLVLEANRQDVNSRGNVNNKIYILFEKKKVI